MRLLQGALRGRLLAATALAGAMTAFGGGAMAQDAPVATAPAVAPADPREAKIEALEAQVQELAAEIQDLKASTSAGLKDVRVAQTTALAALPKVSLPNGAPTIASADGRFTAAIHAVMQFDAGFYSQGNVPAAQTDPHSRQLNDGTNFRRARIGVGGKLFGDFNYNVLYDFGGSGAEDAGKIQELWVEYAGFKPFRARVGAFAPLVGMEDAVSTNSMLFVERPTPSELARSSLAAGDRRTGVQLAGNGDHWLAAFAVTGDTISSLNTAATAFNLQSYSEQLGFTGRLAFSPIHGQDYLVHIGVNGQYVAHPDDTWGGTTIPAGVTGPRFGLRLRDRPELTVDTTRLIDTGAIDSDGASQVGGELGAQWKNFYAEGEYFDIHLDRRNAAAGVTNPSFAGWYAEGSWILTGEARRYNPVNGAFDGPLVAHPFSPKDGGLGAFELAARYSDEDLNYHTHATLAADRIRGGDQKIFSAGLNWYANNTIRFMFDYLHVDVERLNAAGLEIGQTYNAVAVRSQMAF